MREIWFRGKRKDNGEWVEGFYLSIGERAYIICEAETSCIDGENTDLYATEWYEIDPGTVCQYTGLIDKNGRKIFEGDIVNGHEKRGAAFWHCKVAWNEENARFDVVNRDCGFPICVDGYGSDIFIRGFDYEVIGNIFNNPELIKENA